MKTLLATLATVVLGFVALPHTAEARPNGHHNSSYTYHSGNSSCGCATYTRRVFNGYDCHQRPTYRYYSVPVVHRCSSSRHGNHYGSHYSGHNQRGYVRSRYSNRRSHRSSFSLRSRYGNMRICR